MRKVRSAVAAPGGSVAQLKPNVPTIRPRRIRELLFIVLGVCVLAGLASALQNAITPPNAAEATPSPVAAANAATVSEPEPTDAPTPKPDRHGERQMAQDYWQHVISKAAFAETALTFAGASLVNEDKVSAYQMLQRAKQYAFDAANASSENVPPGWDDVHEHMSNAMSGFGTAYEKMADALDSDRTSDYAKARDDAGYAQSEYGEAVHLARVHYISMGGRWQDVSDGTVEAKSMMDLFKALAGSK